MNKNTSSLKWVAVGVLMLAAFFGAYAFAQAKTGSTVDPGAFAAAGVASPVQVANAGAVGTPAGQSGATSGSGGAGCACCGSTQPTANGVTGPETPGTATVEAGVQKITVDLSKGYYAPNVIKVKAGTPVEITFGQGSGCTAIVQSQDLGFQSDLSAGPQTVALNAMKPGTYSFACGMNMVFGKIVAE
jgi:plastocyanin